jgi:hypothetical protein
LPQHLLFVIDDRTISIPAIAHLLHQYKPSARLDSTFVIHPETGEMRAQFTLNVLAEIAVSRRQFDWRTSEMGTTTKNEVSSAFETPISVSLSWTQNSKPFPLSGRGEVDGMSGKISQFRYFIEKVRNCG